jgi:death-on-curing protein
MAAGSGAVRYLSGADVVAIHNKVMESMGWTPAPLRDAGALEGAVYRCQQGAYYEGLDVWAQATVLAVGVAEAQAFGDGNKRTGLVAALTFLGLNGQPFRGDRLRFAERLVTIGAVRSRDAKERLTADLAAFLREA